MKILNLLVFVKTLQGHIGIADEHGSFASTGWCISQEFFETVGGHKFGWYAPNGNLYIEDKDIMTRPTEDEVKAGLAASPKLLEIAIENKYVEV